MLTWRTRNSPYLPLHKEARDSQHQSQLVMGANRQTDMEITKDRKRQEQEGSGCSHGHLAGQAGSWGHSLVGRPTTPGDQHLTGFTPLPAQAPALLVVISWSATVLSISGSISQGSCGKE